MQAQFETLNPGISYCEFDRCHVLERHVLSHGLHVYLASNDTENRAVILDPWVQGVDQTLTVTNRAADKFREFLGRETANYPNHVRLLVNHDDSTGYVHDLKIDNGPIEETDWGHDMHGFVIAIDYGSWPNAKGATVDWVVHADGKAGFTFDNPNDSTSQTRRTIR
ncbi:iron-sulfur cluster assembly accessory protein [Rosistilla ulvae]|nr:hypothetical protein [Rosistilla ulvae]